MPNVITVLRIIMTPCIYYTIYQQKYFLAVWLLFFAGFSDWLDGFLARRYQLTTSLGALLDALADKLLVFTVFLALIPFLPFWLVIVVLLRDILIICGGVYIKYKNKHTKTNPLMISKINTCFQLLLAGVVLTNLTFNGNHFWIQPLCYITLVTTVWSGFSYAKRLV